jgi:hypothetical protein
MDNVKNIHEHTLDEIKSDIKQNGYSSIMASFITNMFEGINLKEYFESHGYKIRLEEDRYIFTPL